jgi:hypothetical protein
MALSARQRCALEVKLARLEESLAAGVAQLVAEEGGFEIGLRE